MTIQEQMMNLSDEERDFWEKYAKLPPHIQKLYQLMIAGSPEQQLEAELKIYDLMDERGHDTTELREMLAERLEKEAQEKGKKG